MIIERMEDEVKTNITKLPIGKFTAYLDYYGEPRQDEDPADFFIHPRGVRLA